MLGWSQLPLPQPPLHVHVHVRRHVHDMAGERKVPGNFIVFSGKTWSRKGRFTCHHTSWKSSGLSSLPLLVSCGPCSGSAPSLVPSHGSKRGGRASAWHRRRRARPARAASMNRKSFSRITWWVKKGRGELLLPLSRGAQANVVSLFQVQETQESCGELRRQKDAKWDLGRTRYGEVCFQTLRFVCVCLVL